VDIESLPLDQLDVISARHYGESGYPHAEWARLRRESPVHFMRPPGYQPFWAVTKHADITEVSKQPEIFRSAGRFILFPENLGPGGQPLARVTAGIGNDGQTEGAWHGKILGTYSHGPALARNPAIADLLLLWSIGADSLSPVDDTWPDRLRAERLAAAGA